MKYKILYHMLKKVKASLSGGDLGLIDKELLNECKKDYPSIDRVKLLLEIEPKANPNIKDDDGNTPALLAAKKGNSQIFEILIENGARIDEKDAEGNTCIMLAAEVGSSKILTLLTGKVGADINEKNTDGNTAALLAAKKGYVEILTILIEKGADINEEDADGNTCIMLAASQMNAKMFNYLLSKNAKCDDTIMNVANKTTLDLAEENRAKHEGNANIILPYLKTLSLTNQLEKSPSKIDLEQIKKLFSSEPVPGQIVVDGDPINMTVTMLASINRHLDALKYLVEQGFDYKGQDMDGMTCTLYAAQHGHLNILEYLVEKGAKWDESITNNDEETCMILAVKSGDVEMVKYLVSKGGVCEPHFIQLTQDDTMIKYLQSLSAT